MLVVIERYRYNNTPSCFIVIYYCLLSVARAQSVGRNFFFCQAYVHTDVDNLILLYLITVRAHRRRVLLLRERVISAHKTRDYDQNVDVLLLLLFLTMLPCRTGNAIKVRYSGRSTRAHEYSFLIFIHHDDGRRPSSHPT